MRAIVSLAVIGLATSAAAAAKAPPTISPYVNALDQCRQIADSMQRLACYDRTAGALVTASRSGEINVVDRGQMREARRTLFGFSMPKLPFFSGDTSVGDTPDQIETTIKETFRVPKAGQKIIIKRGPMGSYFLRINGNTGVKGRRVG